LANERVLRKEKENSLRLSNYRKQDWKKMMLVMTIAAAVVIAVIAAGVWAGGKILKPKITAVIAESKERKAEQQQREEQEQKAKQRAEEEMKPENEKEEEGDAAAEADIPANCFRFGGHSYYYFEHSEITWEEAKARCEARGGHLLTITSQEEQDAVYGYIQQYAHPDIDIWIGIQASESEKPWSEWVTGEAVTYTNWGEGEPDGTNGQCYGAICNGVRTGSGYHIDCGQWDDLNNGDETVSWGGYLCEWDMEEGGNDAISESAADGTEEDYILPESNIRYLDRTDLEGLNSEELRLARNEIYARHGRIFEDEDLRDYFSSKDWYTGTLTQEQFQDNVFNEYEKQNLILITDYENEINR